MKDKVVLSSAMVSSFIFSYLVQIFVLRSQLINGFYWDPKSLIFIPIMPTISWYVVFKFWHESGEPDEEYKERHENTATLKERIILGGICGILPISAVSILMINMPLAVVFLLNSWFDLQLFGNQ